MVIEDDKINMKRVSINGLSSKINMRITPASSHQITHTDKSVQSYLKEWSKGKAVIPQDWHNQIEMGKLANNQNNGLIVGRKRCQQCRRFRCQH